MKPALLMAALESITGLSLDYLIDQVVNEWNTPPDPKTEKWHRHYKRYKRVYAHRNKR